MFDGYGRLLQDCVSDEAEVKWRSDLEQVDEILDCIDWINGDLGLRLFE